MLTLPLVLPLILAAAPTTPFPWEEATVADLQAAQSTGKTSARALAEAYLKRIAELDPTLHAFLETNPAALTEADALDAERKTKGPRGPLHGIPVVLKDNIATRDRLQTTAGSLALVGSRPPKDSTVAAKLRAAGLVILGKANLSEWANMRSTHSSSGWSGRGGQARNPYALDRSPCGSSSGTGVAVAANLVAVGVGTETDGSILCPSNVNGLVGLKPTVGLVSRSGIVPIAHSQDTSGPMTRTVADAAALLTAMAGVDAEDPATAASKGKAVDYSAALDGKVKGLRVGVARERMFGASPEADRAAEAAISALKALGVTIVDPADIPHLGEYDAAELEVLLYEFKADLDAYLPRWAPGAPVQSLAEAIAFNTAHAAQELPFFGQELFLKAQAKGPLTDKAYRDALAKCRRLARTEGLDATFAKHKLDALLAPTGSAAWLIDLIEGDHFVSGSSTPAAVAGYPAITVPAGQHFGLPVGVTFMGPAWSEATLLRLAHAYEQATRHRQPPKLLPTADLTRR